MRLLLTDESIDVLNHLAKAMGDFFEICTCNDGYNLMEYVETFRPQLMVLDLAMPEYDALAFLTAIRHKKIQVIATNYYISDYLSQRLLELDVRWLICKPYLANVVAGRLLEMALEIEAPPDKQLRNTVHKMLMELGINMSRNVFRLLTEGIIFAVLNPNCALLDELYPYVAQRCDTSATSVEVTMRRGIEIAYKFRRPYSWKCVFGQDLNRTPTNGQFIKHLANLIRNDLYMEQ